ncbi:MAG: GatB/YqeY domain-containing protein [Tenericutes bacterium]|nr:GatB/YqeY domain-containing protein [Mycoplasmatota bacterium]
MVEKLKADMIQAMKEKDKERLTVIRMVKAAMDLEHIDRKREINDELLIDVVSKQVKMREESILEFEKGNREDLIEKTKKEIEILKAYLPEQLSESEVVEEIEKIFAEVKPESVKDMGKVMKEATAKLRGRADMKKVSEIIKSKLQ